MSEDKKDSQDLTRIEDLSDFIHDESEEISLLETDESENDSDKSIMDLEKESFGESTTFMQIPDELSETDEFATEQIEDSEKSTDTVFDQSFNDQINDDFTDDFNESSSDSFENNFIDEPDTNFSEDLGTESELSDDDESNNFEDEANLSQNAVQPKENIESLQEIKEDISLASISNEPIAPPKDYKTPENLDDVKEFGQVITSTDLSIEGNPPFSIIASKIKFIEDTESILEVLKEYKIVQPEHEKDTIAALQRGQILIPRLSEYSAIILYHKLRQFDLNLKMGLSHEIQEISTFESSDKGLINRSNINTNKKSFEDFDSLSITKEEVQVTTLATFENFSIVKSIAIKSKSKTISNIQLTQELFDKTYSDVQDQLIDELKQVAISLNANGLVNTSLSLINMSDMETNFVCTASIVKVVSN